MVLEADSQRHPSGNDSSSVLGVYTAIILTVEFMLAMWIRGIPYTAALFALMTLAFGIVSGGVFIVARKASRKRGATQYSTTKNVLVIGLVASACMALLAGIFALPLLFNGASISQHFEWRTPAISGSRTNDNAGNA